jgi:hypothetical protein
MDGRDSSGRQQLDVMVVERDRIHAVCRTFAEIQAGPNPLTPDEIARLAKMRPQYAVLQQYADRAREWVNENHPDLDGLEHAAACGEAAEEIALLDGES